MCQQKKWTRRRDTERERESSPLLSHKSCARSTAPLIRNKCIFYVYMYGAYVNATHPPPPYSMYAKLTKIKRNLTRNSAHHLVYIRKYYPQQWEREIGSLLSSHPQYKIIGVINLIICVQFFLFFSILIKYKIFLFFLCRYTHRFIKDFFLYRYAYVRFAPNGRANHERTNVALAQTRKGKKIARISR